MVPQEIGFAACAVDFFVWSRHGQLNGPLATSQGHMSSFSEVDGKEESSIAFPSRKSFDEEP